MPLKRGVVALVLLSGGLLLLGGLLASVEPTDLAPSSLQPRSRNPDDRGGTDRLEQLEQIVGAQAVTFVEDVELEIPEGSSLIWDGDDLQVIGNVTLTIPEGTTFENLTIVLPEKTLLHPTDGSQPGMRMILLAPDTRIRLPPEYDASAFRLPQGGEVRDHFIPLGAQRDGLERHNLTLRQVSLLETPQAVLEDAWKLRLEQDAPMDYAAFAPLFDQMLDPDRTYTNETLSLSTENTPLRPETPQGPPETGAAAPGPGSPPPWWAWMIVGAIVAGVALYTGARQVPALLRRPPSSHQVHLRLDERPDGLALATEAARLRTLHIRLTPRNRSMKRPKDPHTQKAPHVRIRLLPKGRLFKGRINGEEAGVPLPPLDEGDHEILVQVKRSPLSRAHRMRHLIRVAPWEEQVARDYHGLAQSVRNRHPDAPAITPRQCRSLLERLAATHTDDAEQVVKTFEESSYSPKQVHEEEWVQFAVRVARLRQALITQPSSTDDRRHGRNQNADRPRTAQDPRPAG